MSFQILTDEASNWNDEFRRQCSTIENELHRIEIERNNRIRSYFNNIIRKIPASQGDSKAVREFAVNFDSTSPSDLDAKIYVLVRDGWNLEENIVREDATKIGSESPAIFVFIPKIHQSDFHEQIKTYLAANATLDIRGVVETADGKIAQASMETKRDQAVKSIEELVEKIYSESMVFQGGGNEISGENLHEKLIEASNYAMQRLYPKFSIADHSGWSKVYSKAKDGAPDALKALGYVGNPESNLVCKEILEFISGNVRGTEIRKKFDSPPYGWSRDSIDGALQVLLESAQISVSDDRGKSVEPSSLDRSNIGKFDFKRETVVMKVNESIKIRELMMKVGISATPNAEQKSVPEFLEKMKILATGAGGESPKPELPNTEIIEKIEELSGNEQLKLIFEHKNTLEKNILDWKEVGKKISKRWLNWEVLKQISSHVSNLEVVDSVYSRIDEIEKQRLLLNEPDLILPVIEEITQELRIQLNSLQVEYDTKYKAGMSLLKSDEYWESLDNNVKSELLLKHKLDNASCPKVKVGSTKDIIATLNILTIPNFRDTVEAIPVRFKNVADAAAKVLEPKVQFVNLPLSTLKSEQEVQHWLDSVSKQIFKALKSGPVKIG